MARSADDTIATVSVLDVLLAVLLSAQEHATVAALMALAGALAATSTFRVMVAVPPAAMGVAALVHVTSCPAAEQENPPADALANVSASGNASVTVIVPVVAAEPLLVT